MVITISKRAMIGFLLAATCILAIEIVSLPAFSPLITSIVPESQRNGSVEYTIPDPPTNLNATPGDELVDLSWSAPAKDGGTPILKYIIYRNTTQGGPYSFIGEKLVTRSTAVFNYTDTGLTNGV